MIFNGLWLAVKNVAGHAVLVNQTRSLCIFLSAVCRHAPSRTYTDRTELFSLTDNKEAKVQQTFPVRQQTWLQLTGVKSCKLFFTVEFVSSVCDASSSWPPGILTLSYLGRIQKSLDTLLEVLHISCKLPNVGVPYTHTSYQIILFLKIVFFAGFLPTCISFNWYCNFTLWGLKSICCFLSVAQCHHVFNVFMCLTVHRNFGWR